MNNEDALNRNSFLASRFGQAIGNQASSPYTYMTDSMPMNLHQHIASPPLNMRQHVTSPPLNMQQHIANPLLHMHQHIMSPPLNMHQQVASPLMNNDQHHVTAAMADHRLFQPHNIPVTPNHNSINFSGNMTRQQQEFLSDNVVPLNLRQATSDELRNSRNYAALVNNFSQYSLSHRTSMSLSSSGQAFATPDDNRQMFSPPVDNRHAFSPRAENRRLFSPQSDSMHNFSSSMDNQPVFSSQEDVSNFYAQSADRRAVFSPHLVDRRAFSSHGESRNVFSPHGNAQVFTSEIENRRAFSSTPANDSHSFPTRLDDNRRLFSPHAVDANTFSPHITNHTVSRPADSRHAFSPHVDERHTFSPNNFQSNTVSQMPSAANAFVLDHFSPNPTPGSVMTSCREDKDSYAQNSEHSTPQQISHKSRPKKSRRKNILAFDTPSEIPVQANNRINEPAVVQATNRAASMSKASKMNNNSTKHGSTTASDRLPVSLMHPFTTNSNLDNGNRASLRETIVQPAANANFDRSILDRLPEALVQPPIKAGSCNTLPETLAQQPINADDSDDLPETLVRPCINATLDNKVAFPNTRESISVPQLVVASNGIVKSEILRFSCPVCDTPFDHTEDLKQHMLVVHSVAPPDGQMSAEIHRKTVIDDDFDVFSAELSEYTKFSCGDCSAEFKSKEKLIMHVRKHAEGTTLLCTICGKSFFKSDKLARHMLVHSGERPYVCRHCGATFTRSDKLRSHLRARHDDMSYSCRICRETFGDFNALKLHLARRRCDKYLPTDSEEQERRRREREALETSFNEIAAQLGDPEIDIALMLNRDKLSASLDAIIERDGEIDPDVVKETVLKDVMNSPSIGMPLMSTPFMDENLIAPPVDADSIRAKATHEKNLERIIKRINKYRTIACPHCGLKLPGAYTYTRHLRIAHSIVKTYQYKKKDRQPKIEGVPAAPRIRIKRPSAMKLCQCLICGKNFTKLDTLKRHEVTHTGERAYKCMYCDAKYSRSDRLRKHLRTSHTAAAYPCIKCELVFETKPELRSHISVHRIRAGGRDVIREKPSIRGPYKKRKLKLGVIGDASIQNDNRNGVTDFPASSINSPVTNHQPHVYTLSATSYLNRPIVNSSEKSDHIEQNKLSSNDGIAVDSDALKNNPFMGGGSESFPRSQDLLGTKSYATGSVDKEKFENIFRLTSEELSKALALRNHIKMNFNSSKLSSSTVDMMDGVTVKLEGQIADVRVKRKYIKRKNRVGSVNDSEIKLENNWASDRPEKTHKCSVCPKMFCTRREARKHELTHKKVKPFECKHCFGRFTRLDNLQSHIRRAHDGVDQFKTEHPGDGMSTNTTKVFMCKHCKKVFDIRRELKQHMKTHREKKQYKIEESDGELENDLEPRNHMFAAYEDAELSRCAYGELPVNVVGKFKRGRKPASLLCSLRNVGIKQEMDQAQPDVTVKQEPNEFADETMNESLAFPQNEITSFNAAALPLFDDRTRKCRDSVISYNCSDTTSIKSEDETSSSQIFTCALCGKKVDGELSLRRHIRLFHSAPTKLRRRVRHRCAQCGKRFKEIFALRRHMEHHEAAQRRIYDCLECGMTFRNESSLHAHTSIHTGLPVTIGQVAPIHMKRPYRRKSLLEKQIEYEQRMARRRQRIERSKGVCNLDTSVPLQRNSHGLFQCTVCEMSFSMVAKLRRHVAIHTGERPYQCKRCEQTFARSDRLRTHLGAAHGESSHSCLFCDEMYESKAELRTHTRKHVEHRAIMEANKLFSRSNMIVVNGGVPASPRKRGRPKKIRDIDGHQTAVVKAMESGGHENDCTDESVKTEVRRVTFLGDGEAADHNNWAVDVMQAASDAAAAVKDEIGISFAADDKKILRGRFAGDKHLLCPICNKGMSSPHSLKRHVTCAHTDERPYVCCDCPKTFSRMDKFRNHLRRHYGFIYPCMVCGETFMRWYHWKKHTLIHSMSCDVCDFTCVSHVTMARHMSKHTGEKQFACLFCGKRFWRNYHLQIHTRLHTGEMPYSCDKCGRRFFRSDRLKRHMESHDRDCGLLCSTCGKSFTSNIALKVHSHIHDDILPQLCFLCNAMLPNSKEMRKHRKRVHPGETFFFCSICNQQFRSHAELLAHSPEHFDGQNPPDGFNISADGKILLKARPKQPYLCSMCGLQLSSRHALIRHQHVHTGERNYTCQYCAQQFSTSYGLRRHVERHEKNGGGPIRVKVEKGVAEEVGEGMEYVIGVGDGMDGISETDRGIEDIARITVGNLMDSINGIKSKMEDTVEVTNHENDNSADIGSEKYEIVRDNASKPDTFIDYNQQLDDQNLSLKRTTVVENSSESFLDRPFVSSGYDMPSDSERTVEPVVNDATVSDARQPLDLAKIASSVGIDISGHY